MRTRPELISFYYRLKRCRTRNVKYPTRPNNFLEQAYATGMAILREMSYPQFLLKNRWFTWLSPPRLGRVLFLTCYWSVIVCLMTNKAVVHDAYYWERIGFRNAGVSVTQVPLVYLLASKSSLVCSIVGSSHERLNWLHRWVSRTLLLTVTVHGGFFMAEWVRADFVKLELEMMPMVKYGIGAWRFSSGHSSPRYRRCGARLMSSLSYNTLQRRQSSSGFCGPMFRAMRVTMSGLPSERYCLTGYYVSCWPCTGMSEFDKATHAIARKRLAIKLRHEQWLAISRLLLSKTSICHGNQVNTCTCGFQDLDFSSRTLSRSPLHAYHQKDVTAARFN